MATFLVAVLSNPAEGREDEFNEWYEHTHLDEVLSSAGFRSAPCRRCPPRERTAKRSS